MKEKDIIIISSIDWDIHKQWHHAIVEHLLINKNKVLFIENTGTRRIKINELKRVFSRIKKFFKSDRGFNFIDNYLTIYSPLIIPLPLNNIIKFFNSVIIINAIKKWSKYSTYNNAIIISFLPTPLANSIIKNFPNSLSVYLCADNFRENSSLSKNIAASENLFMKSVDIIFSSSPEGLKRAKHLNKNSFKFNGGVDFNLFAKNKDKIIIEKLSNFERVIGYLGAIREIVDQDLILHIADQFPNYAILIIGPKYCNISKLKQKNNIIIVGGIEHNEVPKYIKNFNIGIIPYIKNNFTDGIYPAKLNEYLASNLDVISTNINGVLEYNKENNNIIQIAKNKFEFVDYINQLFNHNNNKKLVLEKENIAKKYSWNIILDNFFKIIEQKEEEKKSKINFNSNLKNYILNSRFRFVKFISLIFISYIFVFHSSIFYHMGNKLIIEDKISNSDSIIVIDKSIAFKFYNLQYKKRLIDIEKYFFDEKYSDNLLIFSNLNQNILSNYIYFESYFNNKEIAGKEFDSIILPSKNTYQIITRIENELNIRNYKKTIILTNPYHRLRLKLIWNKYSPDRELLFAKTIDTVNVNKWSMKYSEIKIIMYEYLSIIYNFLRKKL